MRTRRMLLVAPLALMLAAPAAAAVANLDADPANETVRPFDPPPASTNGRTVVLKDRCGSATNSFTLAGLFDRVRYIRVRELDGKQDRPEVLFELRSANGRQGLTRIVRLGRPGQTGCAKPRRLFSYNPKRPQLAPPPGLKVVDWRVTSGDYSTAYPGNELRLWEGYVRKSSSSTRPTLQRITDFRYSSADDTFFSYRSEVGSPG